MCSTLRHHSVILCWKSLTYILVHIPSLGFALCDCSSRPALGCNLLPGHYKIVKRKMKQMPLRKCAKCARAGSFQFITVLCIIKCPSVCKHRVEVRSCSEKPAWCAKKQHTNLAQCFPCRNQATMHNPCTGLNWITFK